MNVGEGDRERKLILNFLIISYWGVSRGNLGRSFLTRLDVVASLVHLKVTYYNTLNLKC